MRTSLRHGRGNHIAGKGYLVHLSEIKRHEVLILAAAHSTQIRPKICCCCAPIETHRRELGIKVILRPSTRDGGETAAVIRRMAIFPGWWQLSFSVLPLLLSQRPELWPLNSFIRRRQDIQVRLTNSILLVCGTEETTLRAGSHVNTRVSAESTLGSSSHQLMHPSLDDGIQTLSC